MTMLYMVTDGEYSDYRVLGIYSTRRLAVRAAKLHASDNPIETFELDDMPDAPPGMNRWRVDMDRDGNSHRVVRSDSNVSLEWTYGLEWRPGLGSLAPGYSWLESRYPPCVAFFVWARNPNSAVKIANERRTRLIADGEWTTVFSEWGSLVEVKGAQDV